MKLASLPWRWWRNSPQSLSLKLTLTITGLVMGIVGSTTMLFIQKEQQNFRAELEYQAQLLLDTITVTVQEPLYNLDADLLRDFMQALGDYQELLTSGYVYDEQGYMLADANLETAVYTTEIDPIGQQLVQSSTPVFDWQPGELRVGQAVKLGRQTIGAIQIGLSTAPLNQKVAAVRNRGILIAIAATIIGATLAQWISRSITQPIQALVEGTQQLADGNFEHPIEIYSKDELGVLAVAFNEMGEKLQKTLHLLGEKNQDLEQQTQELTQLLDELQSTQTQLIQSEKMSSLGQLVAGVAHEINNPVNFIYGNIQYLEEHTQELLGLLSLYQKHTPETHPEIIERIEDIDLPFVKQDLAEILRSMSMGTERITEIVLSLRNFSRLDESSLKKANLHEGLDSTLMILQHRLQANAQRPEIVINKNYGNVPLLDCHPGQLNQVFMNLLANAIDALEEGNAGQSYTEIEANPNTITITTHCSARGWLTINIRDNGPGIPEDVRAKLFNPFFTTKPVGKGTGLGLSISYRIITETHQGTLSCQSKLGHGTTFIIGLPLKSTSIRI